jgi:hypothetical protein
LGFSLAADSRASWYFSVKRFGSKVIFHWCRVPAANRVSRGITA